MPKLNIGCGCAKIEDYINIDCDPSVKPDIILDITTHPLPFEDKSIDEVTMFHTIEHINRKNHQAVLAEVNRALKLGGTFIVSFPDGEKCVRYFLENTRGMRDYWEKTILGRGITIWDRHAAIILTVDFLPFLRELGFGKLKVCEEVNQPHNTVIMAEKTFSAVQMADLVKRELQL